MTPQTRLSLSFSHTWRTHNPSFRRSDGPIINSTLTMSTKAALKAAKTAIGARNWTEAKEQATAVLEKDATNYFAKLFLGRANSGLSLFDDAAKAYNDATSIKPDEAQAWLGLREMYESLGPSKVTENIEVGLKLAEIYMNACVRTKLPLQN